jgi:hypothetical protein
MYTMAQDEKFYTTYAVTNTSGNDESAIIIHGVLRHCKGPEEMRE